MSNDLISRKALIEEIDSLYMSITGLRAGKGVLLKFMEEYKKSVLKCIDEAPTAYDIDTVCEEISNVSHGYLNVETEEEIIEIVKNGGNQ